MGTILAHYMTLVPTVQAEGHLTLSNGSVLDFDDTRFHQILFGGDQFTVARIRGTQALRDTHDKQVDRLNGLIPVIEDCNWHGRMTVMKVNIIILAFTIHFCICFESLDDPNCAQTIHHSMPCMCLL